MSIRLRRLALSALLLCASLPVATHLAHADGVTLDSPDGPKRLVRYTGCASALALATSFTQAYSAILICINVVLDEVQSAP